MVDSGSRSAHLSGSMVKVRAGFTLYIIILSDMRMI